MNNTPEEPFGLTAEERNFISNQLGYVDFYNDLRGVTPDTVKRLIRLIDRLHSQLDRQKLIAAETARQACARLDLPTPRP